MADITREFISEIVLRIPSEFALFLEQPTALVGKRIRIKQKFQQLNETIDFFSGDVL